MVTETPAVLVTQAHLKVSGINCQKAILRRDALVVVGLLVNIMYPLMLYRRREFRKLGLGDEKAKEGHQSALEPWSLRGLWKEVVVDKRRQR